MKTLSIDGVVYKLIPVEEKEELVKPAEAEENPLKDYFAEERGEENESSIRKAEPKVFEYRERYKKRDLRLEDISPPQRSMRLNLPQQGNSDIDSLNRRAGYDAFFGPGTQLDI